MGENEVNEKWEGDPPTWDELEELPDSPYLKAMLVSSQPGE